MPETPPVTQVRTKSQLLQDFLGGQEPLLKLRNLIETIFDGATQAAVAYLVGSGTTARSNKQRFEEVFNVLDWGADKTGASPGTFNTPFEATLAAVVASGVKEATIRIAPGRFRLHPTDAIHILQTDSTVNLTIEGAGSRSTTIIGGSSAVNMFEVGAHGDTVAAKTRQICFKGMRMVPGNNNPGSVFSVRNSQDLEFEDILFEGGKNGFSFGVGDFDMDGTPDVDEAGSNDTITANDCAFMRVVNCGGTFGVKNAFQLGAVGTLYIQGAKHRWNSSGGANFISCIGGTSGVSVDGLYVTDVFAEDFNSYLDVNHALINCVWTGGQMDGGTGAVVFNVDAGGAVRGAVFSSISVRQIGGNFMSIDNTLGAGIAGVNIVGCDFFLVEDHVVHCVEGSFTASGNSGRNCGYSGTSLFLFEAAGNGTVVGNRFEADPDVPPAAAYTYGTEFIGASTGRRSSTGNNFLDFATAATVGTP